MNSKKKILLVGLFLSPSNKKKILRTAADQLAEILDKHHLQTITVSTRLNHIARLIDTLFTVISKSNSYSIAIVPLYGSYKSHVWESVTTRLLKLLGKKVILIVHGGLIPQQMETNAAKYIRSFKRADKVVCPSGFIANAIHQHNISSTIIENVVKLQDYTFHYKQKFHPRILWMRTLEDIYNPEMAVRVAAILVKKYPDLKMVMAGYDKGSLAMVKQLVEQNKLTAHIEFPGYISTEQKNNYSEELDIYVCTNRVDNAPVSFIEMLAMGLPIVSVKVGGIPYLVKDGENALLVSLDDDVAMADKISSIIEQPELGKKLAANGLLYSKKFGEEPVLKKWKEAFEQL